MADAEDAPYIAEFEAEAAKVLASSEDYARPLKELLEKYARKYATDHSRA